MSIFVNIEKKILDYWNKNDLFNKSIENRNDHNEFVFYDGPPFANGLPHYGHLLTGFVKDVFARYKTLRGMKVNRKFGWDCHGLPAEMGVEKELGIQGRLAIMEYGIDKFNDSCAKSVMKYQNEWEYYINKQARWVDFKNSYKTMDKEYMESVIWAFKNLYDKGLIYKDYKVMYYSWKCQTPLSNFETRMDNCYREKESKAVTVKFKLKTVPVKIKNAFKDVENFYLIVWTTVPWTLTTNLLLAVNKNEQYVAYKKGEEVFIFSENSQAKIIDIIDKSN
jgi:isoleucyl-tRNA synthetase